MKGFKQLRPRTAALLVGGAIAITLLVGFQVGESHRFRMAKNLDIFNAIVKELDLLYVDTIRPEKLIKEGIDNMLLTLDPYTEYYPEEDRSELEQMIKGSFGGIGSLISYNTKLKRVIIAEPYEGTPAATVGLKAGDILMYIDSVNLEGKSTAEVSQLLRGQEGTSFRLRIERPGLQGKRTPMEFTMIRRSIQTPAVPYASLLDGGVGYINLSTFTGSPAKEFKQAFLDLKKQGASSLVIDLRANGGGLMDQAVEIVNYFLPRGKVVVTTKGKTPQAAGVYKTQREPLDTEIPIAILVSNATASAAEILSGALQDFDRGIVVGQRTFGKGLVQVPRSLPYGGTLKLTTSKYYIPSGRCVQAIDYKNRNEDGSVGSIPDSLTKVFYTAGGRPVRDGGGVTPDLAVKAEKAPNILYYLVRDHLIFDFATDYCLRHPSVDSPERFVLSDAEYARFKDQVKAANFTYDQQSGRILQKLKETAEFEGYLTEASDEFKALEQKLKHNLDRDLDYFAKDIRRMIMDEIIKRHYFQRGSIALALKDDPALQEACKALTDPDRYRAMLAPRPVEQAPNSN
ncbi:MAG: S41 family peptidase [Bacteroides sp.]|nr:S41 family peptidase [Bacteroides sp.]